MWKIVLIALLACSDPVETPTKFVYNNELDCMNALGAAKIVIQPAPGSYLVCRKVK